MSALALMFEDAEQRKVYFERERQALQKTREGMEKGKTDDEALRESICLIFNMSITIEEPIVYTQNLMGKVEMPKERQIAIFEEMVRERVVVYEKDEVISSPIMPRIIDLLVMLDAIPDYNILPILKECALSKSERIRGVAKRTTEKIIERLNEDNKTNEVTKFTAFLSEMKQAEVKTVEAKKEE